MKNDKEFSSSNPIARLAKDLDVTYPPEKKFFIFNPKLWLFLAFIILTVIGCIFASNSALNALAFMFAGTFLGMLAEPIGAQVVSFLNKAEEDATHSPEDDVASIFLRRLHIDFGYDSFWLSGYEFTPIGPTHFKKTIMKLRFRRMAKKWHRLYYDKNMVKLPKHQDNDPVVHTPLVGDRWGAFADKKVYAICIWIRKNGTKFSKSYRHIVGIVSLMLIALVNSFLKSDFIIKKEVEWRRQKARKLLINIGRYLFILENQSFEIINLIVDFGILHQLNISQYDISNGIAINYD